MPEKNGYVTVKTFEEKLWNVKGDVDKGTDKMNARIDKYADKSDTLHDCINKIEVSMAEMLSYQKADKENSKRVIDLLTANINRNSTAIDDNKKRINIFSGGVAVLAFIFSYLWSVVAGK